MRQPSGMEERAYEVITQMRVIENQEPVRLRVSEDWPEAAHIWGIPVKVDSRLEAGSIVAEPRCIARQHEFKTNVSKIIWGPVDTDGVQRSIGLEPPVPGPLCIWCGVPPDEEPT